LINTIPDLIWLKDPDGVYLTCNHKFERFFGANRDAIVGKTDYDFVDKELADFFRQHDKKVIESKQPNINEETITFADDGHVEQLETIKIKVLDNNDQLLGILGIGRDITQRKKAEEALNNFFQQPMSLNLIAGLDAAIHKVNTSWEYILGYTEDEVIGSLFMDLIHPDDIESTNNEVAKLADGQTTFHFENRYRHKNGEYRMLAWSATADLEEKLIYAVATDITDKKILEEQITRSSKMEALGQLTGGIAHDFNNILAIILGNLQLLEQFKADNDKADKWIQTAIIGAKRGADITRKLLNFTRKDARKITLVDINILLENIMDVLQKLVTPSIEIIKQCNEDLWLVNIDKGDLEDAMVNMVLNARDAMPDGGTITIAISNEHLKTSADITSKDYVVLAITDTGVGMEDDIKNRILEPFFTTKDTGKGTGLGLSIVYGFIKRSNGFFEVDSEVDKGSIFRVLLPRATSNVINSNQSINDSNEKTTPTPSKGDETILIVDDELPLRELAELQLERLGYKTFTAENADEAMDILKTNAVDLLFSDIIMPGSIDGYELCRVVKEKYPEIKLLLASGYDINKNKNEDNIVLLIKPYSSDQLGTTIRTILDE